MATDPNFLNAFLGGGMVPQQPSVATTPSTAMVPQPPSSVVRVKPPSPVVARRRELEDQARRILAKGGSQADVVRYLELEGAKVNANIISSQPPTQPDRPQISSVYSAMPGGVGTTIELKPETDKSDYALGLSMAVIDGVSFGWGDEAFGSILGIVTGEGAQAGRDLYRAKYDIFKEAHPKTALAAQLAGGIGGAVLAPQLGAARLLGGAKGLSTLGRVGASALEGAAAGTVAGAGAAQGDLSDRWRSAALGGVLGAGLAGAGTGAVKLLGAGPTQTAMLGAAVGGIGGGPLGAAVGGAAGLAAGKLGQAASRGVGTTIEAVANRVPAQFAQRVFRSFDPSEGSPSLQARRGYRQALERDGLSIDDAIAQAEQLSARGAPVSAVDIGGDNTLAFFHEASRFRNPGTQAAADMLVAQQGKQGERLLGRLYDSMRLGVANAYTAGDELVRLRLSRSRPLYEQANQLEVQVTPEIRKVLDNPTFRSLYDDARVIAMQEDAAGLNRGLPVPALQIVQEPVPNVLVVFGPNGQAMPAPPGLKAGDIANASLPVRGLDLLKRAMDTRTKRLGTLGGGPSDKPILDRQLGTALNEQLQTMLDAVGAQAGPYGAARAEFRGFSELLDALSLGKGGQRPYTTTSKASAKPPKSTGPRFSSKPPEVVAREIMRLTSPEQKAMYRIGAIQDVADLMATSTAKSQDAARTVFSTPAMESRLRALFDEPHGPEADMLFDAVRGESLVRSRSGEIAVNPRRTPSVPFREAEGGPAVASSIGFRWAPVSAEMRRLGAKSRQHWQEELATEVSALGMRGATSLDELIATLEGLRTADVTHSQVVPLAVGNVAGRLAGSP